MFTIKPMCYTPYRHVLFNGGYQSLIIRMALLTLICDGYISWAQSAGAGEFFEQEYEFYMICLRLVIGNFSYFLKPSQHKSETKVEKILRTELACSV